jgi:hypothetical protein
MSQAAGDVVEELVKLLGEKVKAAGATEQLGACTFRQGNKTYCRQLEYSDCARLNGRWVAGGKCP